MKILVTGGSGTIGSYLLRELAQRGHTLSCYSRTQPVHDYATWLAGDVTDPEKTQSACEGHEAVMHLAAVPGPGRATTQQMLNVNLLSTVNVLEAAVNIGIDRIVFASSGAASGFTFQSHKIFPQYLPIDEAHPSQPHDDYGLSKLLAELTCKRYSSAYGIQTLCMRINHNWYLDREGAQLAVQSGWAKGMTVEELWDKRYRKVIQDPDGEWPRPGPPPPANVLWAVTDARDAVEALCLAVENTDIKHEVFNITGADTCSLTTTPELLAEHFPQVPVNGSLAGFSSLVAFDKATKMLGYKPKFTWRESDFMDWLKSVR